MKKSLSVTLLTLSAGLVLAGCADGGGTTEDTTDTAAQEEQLEEQLEEEVDSAVETEDTAAEDTETEDTATEEAAAGELQDGDYTGEAEGYGGPLTVEVTVEGGEISDVVVTDHGETEGVADPAIEEVPAAIVENNSTDVETVSGATSTSEAIMDAVEDALADAQ